MTDNKYRFAITAKTKSRKSKQTEKLGWYKTGGGVKAVYQNEEVRFIIQSTMQAAQRLYNFADSWMIKESLTPSRVLMLKEVFQTKRAESVTHVWEKLGGYCEYVKKNLKPYQLIFSTT